MRLSTRTINIILLVCVAAMVAVCAMSICAPVNFDKHRAQREAVVKERLVRIRAAQERYRKATGTYADSFARLVSGGFLADSLQYVPFAEGSVSTSQPQCRPPRAAVQYRSWSAAPNTRPICKVWTRA